MANFKDLDSTKTSARFDGNFGDFEINLSKQMSGYFIITKRGEYSSELVSTDVDELIFKDCVKSVDEIKELLNKKDENSNENSSNNSTFETPEIQSPKPAFEIVDEKPKKKIEIEAILPKQKEPAFSIEEEKIPFEIKEEEKEQTPEIPEKSVFEIESDDEAPQNSENSGIPEISEIAENSENSRIPADDEKIFFAKDIEINEKNVVQIELVIAGYDELCDSFNFLSIPNDCEYKYSIKIGELKAVFIANMSAQIAQNFISGFSFKTKRKSAKLIKIFINESAEPAFSKKLFVE